MKYTWVRIAVSLSLIGTCLFVAVCGSVALEWLPPTWSLPLIVIWSQFIGLICLGLVFAVWAVEWMPTKPPADDEDQ
jgi:protein-S-isoprenylcysteine O-methyltransferase Ste14